jgi:hypothetical protein
MLTRNKIMKRPLSAVLLVAAIAASAVSTAAFGADASPKPPAKSAVDPAKEAAHAKEDIRRHRIIAAAHEAAAKCRESGKGEDACMAELANTCKGIALGKYCGMRHAH